MVQRLVRLICFTSLLLCLGTVGLWVRGVYVGPTYGEVVFGGRSLRMESLKNGVRFDYTGEWPEPERVRAAMEVWNKTAYEEPRPRTSDFQYRIDVAVPGNGRLAAGRCTVKLNDSGKVLRRAAGERPKVLSSHDVIEVQRYSQPLPFGTLILPHWCVAAAFATPSLLWPLRRFRRRRTARRRRRLGLCLRCNYDLRGSANRCPECGSEQSPPCHRAVDASKPS